MVQRPWGRLSQAARGLEPAGMTKEGGGSQRRQIALQGALQCCGHRVLGRQHSAGARAEGAALVGRGRGAQRGGYCARRRCSFRSRSASGAPGSGRAREGACGVPGPGRRSPRVPQCTPVTPGASPAHTRAAHAAPDAGGPGCGVPTASRRRGAVRLGSRVGGRGRGRRLCAGVAGASRAGWWSVWSVPGRWAMGGRSRPGGAVDEDGPGGVGVGVHGAFWKVADRD